jgi:hypothetical protein
MFLKEFQIEVFDSGTGILESLSSLEGREAGGAEAIR